MQDPPGMMFWLHVLAVWIFVLACLALFAKFPLTFPIVLIGVGWGQYALVQAMHESIHQYFRKNRFTSFLSAILTTYPVGFNRTYYDAHLNHHRFFGSESQDPDFPYYSQFPKNNSDFLRRFFWNFSGLSSLQQVWRTYSGVVNPYQPSNSKQTFSNRKEFLMLCGVQILFLFIFTFSFGLYGYFLLWLLPLLTIVKGLSYLRIICEHANLNQAPSLRSFEDSWESRLLGPFGFHTHAEHHWWPQVNYLLLPDLAKALQTQGYTEHFYNGSHLTYLIEQLRKKP